MRCIHLCVCVCVCTHTQSYFLACSSLCPLMLVLWASGGRVHAEAGLQRGRDESVLGAGVGRQSPQQDDGRQQAVSGERWDPKLLNISR